MGRSLPSRMPDDVRVSLLPHAGGMPASSRGSERSADPRKLQQIDPTPEQGSHNPAGRMPALRSVRPDIQPSGRVRMVAQQLSLECARTPIRPLSGTWVQQVSQTGSACRAHSRALRGHETGASDTVAVPTRRSRSPGKLSHADHGRAKPTGGEGRRIRPHPAGDAASGPDVRPCAGVSQGQSSMCGFAHAPVPDADSRSPRRIAQHPHQQHSAKQGATSPDWHSCCTGR